MCEISSSQNSLKMKLDQLECHFTWDLKREDLDLHDLPSRLEEPVRLDLPGAVRAQSSLGFVEFLLGNTQVALTNLQEAERLVTENPADDCEKSLTVTYGDLAWVYFHRKNFPECQRYLKKLEEIPSSAPEVLLEKGWAFLKFTRKYYGRAVDVFQKAVEKYPDNSELNAGYAHALSRTEPYISYTVDSAAVTQLRRAIDLNPNNNVLKAILANKLPSNSESSKNEARQLVDTALNESKDSPEHLHVMRYAGIYFRKHGSVDRAIEIQKKALKTDPSAFIHHQLGLCYKTKKINLIKYKRDKPEIDEARNQSIYHLEKAIRLKPSFIFAMSELAVQYGEKGELEDAEKTFKEAFETARQNQEHLSMVHFHYAQFQQYSNRREDLAIEHYKLSLTTDPDNVEGRKSETLWKLNQIAEKRMRHNPNDQTAKEILEFLQQYVRRDTERESGAEASGSEEDGIINFPQ